MKLALTLILFFSSFFSHAVPKLKQVNGYIDSDCPTWTADRFYNTNNFIYFGVRGATDYGFTYEFPISRDGVDYIWCVTNPKKGIVHKDCPSHLFNNSSRPFQKFENKIPYESLADVSYVNREVQMNAYLKYVVENMNKENIRHPNVGNILELLSRYYLQELTGEYPISEYTIGSGVEYKHEGKPTLGELDIIVYSKITCEVEALGESKASSSGSQNKSLRKAIKQIKRFKDFLYTL